MELEEVISDIGDAIVRIDSSGQPFRAFHPGAGPYGEPQLVRKIAAYLNDVPKYASAVRTKRTPDLLIPNEWAIEFKITRPFGDNGKEAENWSVNLLHPYRGNVSTIGDCYTLADLSVPERRAVLVIGYEHVQPQIDLEVLIDSFEAIAKYVVGVRLSPRVEMRRNELIHPVHQVVRIFGWEVHPQVIRGDGHESLRQ